MKHDYGSMKGGYGSMKGGYGKGGMKSMTRDGEQKSGVESGTCHKEKIGDPNLGMGSVGLNEKPAANPSVSVSRGHTIK